MPLTSNLKPNVAESVLSSIIIVKQDEKRANRLMSQKQGKTETTVNNFLRIYHRTGIRYMLFAFVVAMLAALQLTGRAGGTDVQPQSMANQRSAAEAQWGIELQTVRLTAAGHLIDVRYRVLDPDKAVALMKRGDKAFLIDQASGAKLPVPRTKVGPLRQTGSKPKAGKVYPLLFSNTGKLIESGSKVTLVIGNFRMENIVVGTPILHPTDLPRDKRTKWDGIQKMLGHERDGCIEDCGQDQNCYNKCDKAYKSRLDKEFQGLIYEK